MKSDSIDRDERTIAVENASYRWTYLFLSFGVLTAVAFRSFVWDQASWDLLALVVLSGAVGIAFRLRERAWTGGAGRNALIAAIGGVIVAVLLAYAAQTVQAVRGGYRAAQQASDSAR